MNDTSKSITTRREFIKQTGRLAAVSALAGVTLPHVHAAGTSLIQLALVGCGGRGTSAVADAFGTMKQGPVKLLAMADVFEDRLNGSFDALKRDHADKTDVGERKFIGFDAYKKAMDCLNPGDVAILTTPLAFRWVDFTYAIQKGLNVFMEKPITADGPTSKRMLQLAEQASAKNLKCAVGLMSRHARHMQELCKRIQDGEIGDIVLMRGYRMHPPLGSAYSTKRPRDTNELLWQIRNFHSFLWASGGCFSDFYIHIIDHLCWMKGAWPVKAQAVGGKHYKADPQGHLYVDQNFDCYSVEYTFADGATMMFDGRCMYNCNDIYASYAHGSKGVAVVSSSGDYSPPSSTFKGQTQTRANRIWVSPGELHTNPYTNEWDDLMDAIRNDKPYNEVKRGVEASVTTSMGRMAAHTGQEISFEDMLNCPHEMAPDVANFTMDSPAPVQARPDGRYPCPMPGITRQREY